MAASLGRLRRTCAVEEKPLLLMMMIMRCRGWSIPIRHSDFGDEWTLGWPHVTNRSPVVKMTN
jgi:hypothetical protein